MKVGVLGCMAERLKSKFLEEEKIVDLVVGPDAYKDWGSGVHAFSVNAQSLTLTGLGAWMGLYKVGTTAEVDTPQESVALSILSLTENKMVIFADYGSGVWRFTFITE